MSTNIILKNINSVPLHRIEKLRSYSDSEYVKICVSGEKFYANDTIPNLIDFKEILVDEAEPPFLVFVIVKIEDLYKVETEKGWIYSANVTRGNLDEINNLVKTQKDIHEMVMDVGAGGCYIIVDCGDENEAKQKETEVLIIGAGGIGSHIFVTPSPIDTIIDIASNWNGTTTV